MMNNRFLFLYFWADDDYRFHQVGNFSLLRIPIDFRQLGYLCIGCLDLGLDLFIFGGKDR